MKGEDTLSQLFLLVSFLMTVIMLAVVASLTHQKAALKARYTSLTGLASASFGIFFATALNEIINYGRAYHPDFLILGGIILGFLLAAVTGILYIWSRVNSRRSSPREHVAEWQRTRNG